MSRVQECEDNGESDISIIKRKFDQDSNCSYFIKSDPFDNREIQINENDSPFVIALKSRIGSNSEMSCFSPSNKMY